MKDLGIRLFKIAVAVSATIAILGSECFIVGAD